jgi:hypothetical protein
MKWIKENKFILLLVFIALIILGYPLFVFGIARTFFYSIDPDIVYITNALLYTKARMIVYIDHPGTPTILLLYYLFTPLRLISKYVLHQNFIDWSFNNYAILTYYLRIVWLAMSGLTLLVFLSTVKRITKSKTVIVLTFCLALSFIGMFYATAIGPENFSFFLTAVWLAFFAKFINTRKYLWIAILNVIAGFAFANKFTNVFLLVTSIFLPFFMQREKLGRKFIMLEANVAISFQIFLLGILPITDRLAGVIDWGNSLLKHAGDHGTGTISIFDWGTYSSAALTLIKTQPVTFAFILFTIFLGFYLLFRKKLKIVDPVVFLMFIALAGILVFAKYPFIHYEYVNILLMIFCVGYYLSKVQTIVLKILLPVMILTFLITGYNYLSDVNNQLRKEPIGSVYSELGRWTPYWSANIFKSELDGLKKP